MIKVILSRFDRFLRNIPLYMKGFSQIAKCRLQIVVDVKDQQGRVGGGDRLLPTFITDIYISYVIPWIEECVIYGRWVLYCNVLVDKKIAGFQAGEKFHSSAEVIH